MKKKIKKVAPITDLMKAHSTSVLRQFVATIAHEMSNSLTLISGNIQYLMGELKNTKTKDADAKKWEDYIETLRLLKIESERCSDFTKALQISRGKREPDNNELLNVNQVLGEVVKLRERQLMDKGIKINQDYKEIPIILANKSRIKQVFINLLLNAQRAMPNGGEITIKTYPEIIKYARRKSDVFDEGRTVVTIELTDNGVGIPEGLLKRLFALFYSPTKAFDKQRGLGLFISYGVIKSLGGEIEVESEEGKQTTFMIRLPSAENKKESKNGK